MLCISSCCLLMNLTIGIKVCKDHIWITCTILSSYKPCSNIFKGYTSYPPYKFINYSSDVDIVIILCWRIALTTQFYNLLGINTKPLYFLRPIPIPFKKFWLPVVHFKVYTLQHSFYFLPLYHCV